VSQEGISTIHTSSLIESTVFSQVLINLNFCNHTIASFVRTLSRFMLARWLFMLLQLVVIDSFVTAWLFIFTSELDLWKHASDILVWLVFKIWLTYAVWWALFSSWFKPFWETTWTETTFANFTFHWLHQNTLTELTLNITFCNLIYIDNTINFDFTLFQKLFPWTLGRKGWISSSCKTL